MNRNHGPSFRVQMIPLEHCSVCRGKAVVEGVFHQLDCNHCNASGWVDAATGQALPLESLVTQLGLRLRESAHEVQVLRRSMPGRGPAEQYNQNNRRGAGGSNYTGD